MNRNGLIATGIVCTTALVMSAMLARGGSLAPPVGAIEPTMKTLAEIDPRVALAPGTSPGASFATILIDQPGSYYLTGHLTGESGKTGIAIVASDVTLDLNGFTLQGVPGSLAGLGTSPGFRVCICNGSVIGWGGNGIVVDQTQNAIISDVAVRDNTLSGISAGPHSRFERCYVSGNGGDGISADDDSKIIDCTSINNGGNGFEIRDRCSVANSHASGNDDDELACLGNGSRVEGSVFLQDPDPIGIAAISVLGSGNVFENNRITVNEAGSAGVNIINGTGNMLQSNTIATGAGATGSVAVYIGGGRGNDNIIMLDGINSIGVLFDPDPMNPEGCDGEEETIVARAAGTIGVKAISGSGGLLRSHVIVIGDGAIGIDVNGSSHYLIEGNRFSVLGTGSTAVSLSTPATVLNNVFSAIAPNNLMLTETTGTNSFISRNTFSMRSTGGTAISLATFGNSMATKNVAIGQSGAYSLPEGVQFAQLLVDPGAAYLTDSAANLEISP